MKAPTQPLTSTPAAVFIVQPKGLRRYWGLFRRACVAAYEDNCFGIAKGAAYSSLLAFFPMLAAIAGILVQANAEAVSRVLSRFLFQVVPPGSENLVERQFTVSGQRPVWLLVGATLLSLWAASGAMLSLMEGFQAAYRLPSGRPFIRQRMVAFLMVITLAVPAIGASALILFGSRIERSVYNRLGVAPEGQEIKAWIPVVGTSSRYLIAVGAVILVTALLYYFGPNKPMRLNRTWPGALLATIFWMIATLGFGWYVRNIANYNVMYGSIGAVIALLVWMYLLAIIALLGCEYNAERDRMTGC